MNYARSYFLLLGNAPAPLKGGNPVELADPQFSIKFDQLTAHDADVFIGYSTTPGKVSPIDADKGTEFFRILCSILQAQYMMNPLDYIYTMVTKEVSESNHLMASKDFKHIAQKMSTLRATLFFTADPQIRVWIRL